MKTMYTDDGVYTRLIIDKVYHVKCTRCTVRLLEERFGSIREANRRLFGQEPEGIVAAVVEYLHAMVSVEKKKLDAWLNVRRLTEALAVIREVIERDFPPADEFRAEEPGSGDWDWDALYFSARYRLLMTDAEFWDCTPRRFWKLTKLWKRFNVPGSDLDYYDEKEIYTGAFFSAGKKLRVKK
jgi:hypothetical protein